ncbi:MAG TPA: OadG family protein [Saprospiraceae bacterium]|nr:OadG family protein [Saprospiraceae bacterium]
MTTDLQTALSLFLVGMLAVFTILALVVLSGRVLIAIVNNYFPGPSSLPEELPKAVQGRPDFDPKKLAAITAAVEQVSGGQARIVRIERQKG